MKKSEDVYQAILSLYSQGCSVFLYGMADRFCFAVIFAVLKLKESYPEVKLIAIITSEYQKLNCSDEDKALYKHICDSADAVIFTSQKYFKEAFSKRNNYLIDNCGMKVCYCDEQRGGTMYTYNRDTKKGLSVIDIFDNGNIHSPLNVK